MPIDEKKFKPQVTWETRINLNANTWNILTVMRNFPWH